MTKGEYNKLLNVDLDKGATWVIDSATGTTEDEDNLNIGPECYVHKTEIPGFQPLNLWVRREYISMYKCCMDYFKPENTNKHKSPLLVVTGQPRIIMFSKSALWYHHCWNILAERELLAPLCSVSCLVCKEPGTARLGVHHFKDNLGLCYLWDRGCLAFICKGCN